MEGIEDEDGEVERNDSEQLHVAPDESVPRLEVVVCDHVTRGSTAGFAQNRHERGGGNNFEANDHPHNDVVRETLWL